MDKIPVGRLIVDIGDMSAKKFVWRGTASGTISSKQEKNEKALNTALTKMFENFPQAPGTIFRRQTYRHSPAPPVDRHPSYQHNSSFSIDLKRFGKPFNILAEGLPYVRMSDKQCS